MLRIAALACLLLLASCGKPAGWHATDITGAMPDSDFSTMLRADDGKTVRAKDYRGKVTLLYFGYTNCPDVCPLALSNLAEVLEKLGPAREDVRVLFVSVDPDRDTEERLKMYVEAFAPQVDGLRGSKNAIADTARRYRVAYEVTPGSPGHPYEVTHSNAVFVFDAQGRARLVSTKTDDIVGMAEDVKRLANGE